MGKPIALLYNNKSKNYILNEPWLVAIVQFVFSCISKVLAPIFWMSLVVEPGVGVNQINGKVIILANHKSYFDPLIVANSFPMWSRLRPIYFFSKDELFVKPVSRLFFLLGGAFPVFYGSGMENSLAIPQGLLRAGQTVLIFPEGRCIRDESLGEGFLGAATLALNNPDACIVPMAIRGAYKIGWRFMRVPKVPVKIGEPFTLADLGFDSTTDPKVVTKKFMERIKSIYDTI